MMKIKHIATQIQEAAQVKDLMDQANIAWQEIAHVNWPAFPHCPKVRFRLAYNNEAFLLHYQVNEDKTLALVSEDNGPIWTDSCVEFFVNPGGDLLNGEDKAEAGENAENAEYYYNIEVNCIGKLLVGCGQDRHKRVRAGEEIRNKILRWSSLANETFEECNLGKTWEICLIIPYEVFFKHQIASMQGHVFRANFYKCGDHLSQPHYLSWQAIPTEKPDFHRPEYFAEITCE